MIHYDELIKAEKMGYFSDYETLLFARAKGEIKSVTGVLPLTFTAKGGTAADWVIEGNTQGVGERTENLCAGLTLQGVWNANGSWSANDNYVSTTKFNISEAENISFLLSDIATVGTCMFYDNSISPIANSGGVFRNTDTATYPVPSNTEYISISITTGNATPVGMIDITLVKGSTAPTTYIPYGYKVPLTASQAGQPDKTVDIYIGDSPLTEGETVSKTSTGVDIELFEGENTVSTTLYNKPTMEIDYE